jgi:hypothetical protein
VRWICGLAVAVACVAPDPVHAQLTHDQIRVLRLEATPIGALPPLPLPMPASRDHHYWGVRFQAGNRHRGGRDLLALAGGIDLQWRGGSIFGITGGYQARDCELAGPDCGGHALFGARARFNVVTGGPTVAGMFGDYSATTTLGSEVGVGYAPDVLPGLDACTIDLGMPISLAMLQVVRVVSFVTPGVALDGDCTAGPPGRASFLVGLGMGVQQLFARELDVYLGLQKIFRPETGYQLGVSVTWVHLPSLARPGSR